MISVFDEKYRKHVIIAILVLASVLRLVWLSFGDATTDEVLYAFRAIGMLDYDEANDQPTPLEWFDPKSASPHPQSTLSLKSGIPWWTKLSFHDHPPLVFLVQHWSMRIFGESNFGFRLPSALFGVGSVYLLYLIGSLLYTRSVGVFSALLLAVTVNHVYISRIGLQESQLIFFMLVAIYYFINSLEHGRYRIYTGIAFGLAVLTKYTGLVLIPIFLLYLVLFRRDYFVSKKSWIGGALALVIIIPVVIYNIFLYQAVGHFDFQFSYIFRQFPDVWKIAPGKEIGTLSNRFRSIAPNLFKISSWAFLASFVFAAFLFVALIFRAPRETFRKHRFLVISIAFFFLLVLFVGTSFLFVSLFTPFLALGAGVLMAHLYEKKQNVFLWFFLPFLIFEVSFTFHSQMWYGIDGLSPWLYSQNLRYEKYDGGYNELGKYLARELDGRAPSRVFEMQYQFLDDLHAQAILRAQKEKREPYSAVIIYDGNIDHIAQLWFLDRLNVYRGWPVLNVSQYLDFLDANNIEQIKNNLFEHYYVIIPTEEVFQRKAESRTNVGQVLEVELRAGGLKPISILNDRGKESFRVWRF